MDKKYGVVDQQIGWGQYSPVTSIKMYPNFWWMSESRLMIRVSDFEVIYRALYSLGWPGIGCTVCNQSSGLGCCEVLDCGVNRWSD